MGRGKKIGCVILNFNGSNFTIACAESVLAGNLKPDWLVIVDNASTDDSLSKIIEWSKGKKEGNIIVLPQERNGGYAAGNNAGLRWLQAHNADAFWILNNDTKADKYALAALVDRLYSKEKPGLCGSLILYMDKPDIVQCRGGGKTNWVTLLSRQNGMGLTLKQAQSEPSDIIEQQLNYIYGASILVSRDFIEKVGLLDEDFFLYCEEQDWALRAKNTFDIAYASSSLVWHKEGLTSGSSYRKKTLKSSLRLTKSRLRLAWKHKPWFLPTVILGTTFHLGRKALSRMIKNIKRRKD